jgi:glyoxylase-like metal-dependent hydrolase (beta-lactamase superfamily II)
MQFGHLELFLVRDGTFRLDGGAMFGQVPKVLWERTHPADERNRILLGLNCLLVRTPEEIILIDTGLGDMHDEKFAYLYAVDKSAHSLQTDLAAAGVTPEQVDKVVLSHLHFDHCGGNCQRRDGKVVPTFPNATYHVNRSEFETAKNPDPRSRPSYQPHTWEVLEETGRLVFTEHDEQIAPGIELLSTPGHTLHHQSVLVRSQGRTACFLADLAATSAHLKTNYVMGFDLYPVLTMESRDRVLKQAAAEEWLLFFEHAADLLAGVLDTEGNLTPFDGV